MRLPIEAHDDTGQCDADLTRRDVAIEQLAVFNNRKQSLRLAVAVGSKLADAGAPGADGSELSGDVKRVDRDERKNDRKNDKECYGVSSKVTSRSVLNVREGIGWLKAAYKR